MDDRPNILMVDDEKEIADLVEIHLNNEGYHVWKAMDGSQAIQILESTPIHLVILDIMMPGLDGFEVCRRIRKSRSIPILMLSAKSQAMDKVMGLSTGADDYLTKPFHVIELLARVKAQLRRYLYLNPNRSASSNDKRILAGDLMLDPVTHQVFLGDREVRLTSIEFGVLALLAANLGRVFPAEEIFRRVWKEQYYSSNNTVMVHIRKLREKIEDDPSQPRRILTVWGVGYKFEN